MNTTAHPARYWHTLSDGRVQCDLCPRECQLSDGQRGLCYVRMHQRGSLVLTCHGHTTGLHIDPMEKKPLYHFFPGTDILSLGTIGCNLTCRFCQNWNISRSRDPRHTCVEVSPTHVALAARTAECDAVALTYNEPVVYLEYALDIARACHERGIRTVAVTAGYIAADAREEFFAHMDAANVDLKAFSPEFYRRLCSADIAVVKDTLRHIRLHSDTWLEITTLLIPGENDSDEEITALARWVRDELGPDVPLHLSAFHPAWRMLDHQRTSVQSLRNARDLAMLEGLRFVYIGNVRDKVGTSTHCPHCGTLLIARDGYHIDRVGMDTHGCCTECGAGMAGRFDSNSVRRECAIPAEER
ncbi:MAG TPA: AmmeMemoRadiSam system radical SAM enzyme [Bacteroidota bacterium]|nr:AmmeMemoRadiSam system radical SAM enzyme [Bacteroidota bacterium]